MASFTLRNFRTNIVCAFLAFVRSDAVNVNDGKIWNLGQNGNYWSRTASSSTAGRNLWFNPTDVNPSNSNNRWNGFSLRWGVAAVRCRSSKIYSDIVLSRSRKGDFALSNLFSGCRLGIAGLVNCCAIHSPRASTQKRKIVFLFIRFLRGLNLYANA